MSPLFVLMFYQLSMRVGYALKNLTLLDNLLIFNDLMAYRYRTTSLLAVHYSANYPTEDRGRWSGFLEKIVNAIAALTALKWIESTSVFLPFPIGSCRLSGDETFCRQLDLHLSCILFVFFFYKPNLLVGEHCVNLKIATNALIFFCPSLKYTYLELTLVLSRAALET